ncbi:MAG: hydrogen peroxide-inducible genes activator [Bacteroidia bacterium]
MTLSQLEYVLAVDKHRNFARAADECGVTQPTLSMQLKKLEGDLGIMLFDRSRQPVVPTSAGERIMESIREMHQLSKQIKIIVKEEVSEVKGKLRLGIIPTIAPYLLPLMLHRLQKDYPFVELEIEELNTESLIAKLRKNELDAGIAATPLDEAGIIEKELYFEPFVAYASESHPLLKLKSLNIKDIPLDELWLLGEGHCFRDQVMNLCRKQNQLPNHSMIQLKAGSIETLQRLVEFHKGVTLLPQLAIQGFGDEKTQLLRYFKSPEPVRQVSLLSRRHDLHKPILEALKKSILESVPKSFLKRDKQEIIPL